MTKREWLMLVPLALIVIYMGVWPHPVLDAMNGSVNSLVKFMHENGGTVTSAMNVLPK
jgi:NADH-quinone oxidoreductase subunit M